MKTWKHNEKERNRNHLRKFKGRFVIKQSPIAHFYCRELFVMFVYGMKRALVFEYWFIQRQYNKSYIILIPVIKIFQKKDISQTKNNNIRTKKMIWIKNNFMKLKWNDMVLSTTYNKVHAVLKS